MRVALDAMGGDYAPAAVVEGAVLAAREYGIEVALVGLEDAIRAQLIRHNTRGLKLPIVPASETIEMYDHPVQAVRQKKDSSIVVGIRLVKDGEAAAFVSAGNTGACMAAAFFGLGRIPGIERPALATVFPTLRGKCVLVDVGANADCRPEHLLQFALMGSVYMERIFGVERPRVALLSIGEEETKGNQLVIEAHRLLANAPLNFVGNVEGKDIPAGTADVVVCDGFVGNVVLKFGEGVAATLRAIMAEELTRTWWQKLAALALRSAFRRMYKRMDYAEYGGAPLLGVQGVVIVAHGRSNARAIKNALRVAKQAVEQGLVEHIREGVAPATARSPREEA